MNYVVSPSNSQVKFIKQLSNFHVPQKISFNKFMIYYRTLIALKSYISIYVLIPPFCSLGYLDCHVFTCVFFGFTIVYPFIILFFRVYCLSFLLINCVYLFHSYLCVFMVDCIVHSCHFLVDFSNF